MYILYSFLIFTGALLPGLKPTAYASGLAIDNSVSTHQTTASTSITSGALSTSQSNDLVEAFLTSDAPSTGRAISYSSVTGGGLTWTLRERTNAQLGTAEIWQAVASKPLSNVTVKATRSSGSYVGSINVVAFSGANTSVNGAVAGNSAPGGAPNVNLTTTQARSWVWAVGDDWDTPTSRTVGPGQTLFDQDLNPTGDTYWVQSVNPTGAPAGTVVTANDTAPTTDRWDFSAIEIVPAAINTNPPSTPTNLTATANSSSQVTLSWTASTGNVAGYQILRNGSEIASSTTNNYSDNTVSPSTTYTYNVIAYNTSGDLSGQSNTASVTTPALSGGGCAINGVEAHCIGGPSTGASGWGSPAFDDEFNETSLNPAYWSSSWFNGGTMNNVKTSASNVSLANGDLNLTLSSNKNGATVDTDPSQTHGGGFQFGDSYFAEARVYFPGSGSTIYNWPAFWTDGQSWPTDGEIDVAEGLGTLTSNYHSSQGANNSGTIPGTWAGGWHTYAVDRESGVNYIYWDGNLVRSYATDDAGSPHYLIFTLGCSGSCKTGANYQVKVDYVRVWQKQ